MVHSRTLPDGVPRRTEDCPTFQFASRTRHRAPAPDYIGLGQIDTSSDAAWYGDTVNVLVLTPG
jgi:hypothetical protein